MDGKGLRERRERYGLTQSQVAVAAGMRQPDLSAIENGRRGNDVLHERVEAAIRSLVRPSAVLKTARSRSDVAGVLERYGARDIRVFGSTARGSDRPGSDLDLLAVFPSGTDLFDLMDLEAEIEAALGIRVDVVPDDPRTCDALMEAKAEAIPL